MLSNPWTLEQETCSSPNAFKELKIGCLSLRDSPITYASPVDSETNERHTTIGKHKKHWTKTWIFSSLAWKELIFATSAIYPANLQRKVMLLLCLIAPICAECLSLGDKQDLSTYIPAQFQVTPVPPRLQPSTWRSSSSYSTNEYRSWDSNVSIKTELALCTRRRVGTLPTNFPKSIWAHLFVEPCAHCAPMLLFKEGSVFLYCFFLSPAKKTNANNNSQNSKATVKDSYCTFLARTSVNSHWPFECPGTNPGVQDFCDMRKQCYSLPLLMIDESLTMHIPIRTMSSKKKVLYSCFAITN